MFHRNDLTEDEYQSMKEETVDQIKEFTAALDRLNKGDVTLNSKISSMRNVCLDFLLSKEKFDERILFFFFGFHRQFEKQSQHHLIP